MTSDLDMYFLFPIYCKLYLRLELSLRLNGRENDNEVKELEINGNMECGYRSQIGRFFSNISSGPTHPIYNPPAHRIY